MTRIPRSLLMCIMLAMLPTLVMLPAYAQEENVRNDPALKLSDHPILAQDRVDYAFWSPDGHVIYTTTSVTYEDDTNTDFTVQDFATEYNIDTKEIISQISLGSGNRVEFDYLKTVPLLWQPGRMLFAGGQFSWSPDGQLVSFRKLIDGSSQLVIQSADGIPVAADLLQGSDGSNIYFSPSSRYLLYFDNESADRSEPARVFLVDLVDEEITPLDETLTNLVYTWNRTEDRFAIVDQDETAISIVDAATQEVVQRLLFPVSESGVADPLLTGRVYDVQWRADGKLLFTYNNISLRSPYVWNVETGELVDNSIIPDVMIDDGYAWHPTIAPWLATLAEEAWLVRVRDVDTGELVFEYDFGDEELRDMSWSPDGRYLMVNSDTGVHIFEVADDALPAGGTTP